MSKPLEFSYDAETDTLTVEGVMFSGEVFRAWSVPEDCVYKFQRRPNKGLIVEQVVPCEECAKRFNLWRQCRICGCTNDNPCLVNDLTVGLGSTCAWVEHDLCDACAETPGIVRIRGPLSEEELQVEKEMQLGRILADCLERAGGNEDTIIVLEGE